ncbi:beta-ketoacyl-ACP synthase [Trichocoleus sp. FACHB-262]|uniref:beta-ketoacyl-ACP synthase n=1 Tax=Trichocoleus sp. FACHB-262 TaxID=2692869 RepID=UPI001685AE6C|nr:beta-ketoacyl-ACP synthase [Trichocoleus sp. FACHB-262]MBD2121596.1 beta-ketoacyl-ACP synthase [Trichocoleus sp. FACHB-262]
MDVVVTGIGLVSALGDTLQSSWQKLLANQSGILLRQPFSELEPRPLAMLGKFPVTLNCLAEQVVAAALQDAGLATPLADCGVVIGSSRSYQSQWELQVRQRLMAQALPDDPIALPWLDTLPGQVAIAAARQIGSGGPVLAPMAACATGLWAIAQGYELVRAGQCQRVIAGAVEAPITPLTLAGFQQMGALAATGAYPFDRRREGLVLGEGAAVLVLEPAELAQQRSASIYGRILGFGFTADGYHMSAPDPTSRTAINAVKQCLDRSHLTPEAIDYIHAHGTATQLNDRNEAHLIQHVFPQGVPVSSTKGATGHTLGASGAFGAAFCLMALRHQILPPCVGLQAPEFDLNFVREVGDRAVQNALCFSFGFGGQNAVLAFSQ